MKVSKEWVRQPMVDEAADGIVAAGKYGVVDVTAYGVSKALGCVANGSLHAKVRDWRRRRQDQAAASSIDVPPEAEAEFGNVLDLMTGEAKAVFRRTIQQVGSEFERSKTLRVVDAERRRDAAEAETDKVIELCLKTEAELSDAVQKIEQLEQALVEGRIREAKLTGRLEQLNADWANTLRHPNHDAEQTVVADDSDGAMRESHPAPVTVTDSVTDESRGGVTGDAD